MLTIGEVFLCKEQMSDECIVLDFPECSYKRETRCSKIE